MNPDDPLLTKDPLTGLFPAETRVLVREYLDMLPAADRDLLIRYLEAGSVEGISDAKLRLKIHRIRKRLWQMVAEKKKVGL
ncbi:MAG: hypothetical protein FJW39_25355 [Acidobacteria bacterium]|nr:hypothetical protein [Acidobacteriota bacterium]